MTPPGPGSEDFGARLSFDRSETGRSAVDVPAWTGDATPLPDAHLLRESVRLPEMSQGELVRYYTALSARNFGIDSGTYPLGSCTMKYNPKVNDLIVSLPDFADAHPQSPVEEAQGTLRTLMELRQGLAEITGLPEVSLAPAAGAQGELAGVLMDHSRSRGSRRARTASPHPGARLGAWHQSGDGRDGRLHRHASANGRGRLTRPRNDRARAG